MTTSNDLLKELVVVRIKRVLLRKGQQYERNFYIDVGRGVTPEEYTVILDKLVADGVVLRIPSERGSTVLQLADQPTEVTNGNAVNA